MPMIIRTKGSSPSSMAGEGIAGLRLAGEMSRSLRRREDVSGFLEELPVGPRQFDPVAGSSEQIDPKLFFQILRLLAQRGL